jgi:hypothetical protein
MLSPRLFVLVAVGAWVLLSAAPARAQQQIKVTVELLKAGGDPDKESDWDTAPSERDLAQYFDKAACTCGQPVRLRFENGTLTDEDFASNVEIYLGTRCNEIDNTRDSRCRQPTQDKTFPGSVLRTGTKKIVLDASEVMFPVSGKCEDVEKNTTVFALIDRDTNGMVDAYGVAPDILVDTQPPPLPTQIKSANAEAGAKVTWEQPAQRFDDVARYYIFCEVDGQPITSGEVDVDYELPCASEPAPGGADAGPIQDAGIDAAVTIDAAPPDARAPDAAPPKGIAGLDPRYICATPSISATSETIQILDEVPSGKPIEMRFMVVDASGNFTVVDIDPAMKVPVQDFWETYEHQGGNAEGGYCFVASAAYGDYDHPFVRVLRDFRDGTLAHFGAGRAFITWYYASSPPLADYLREHAWARVGAQIMLWPIVVLAGAWEYTSGLDKLLLLLALILWRRRGKLAALALGAELPRPALAAAAALVVTFAAARAASAQSIYDEDLGEDQTPTSDWSFELKFGPYVPDIDSEPGLTMLPGPYERTYCPDTKSSQGMGGCNPWALMTQIEVQRYFAHPLGQLGLAASVGFMSNTAAAFAQGANGDPIYGQRAPGDSTSFRLLPTSLTVVYRFTQLADDTVIPLVPYGKLGLSYYLWWVNKGNGTTASTGKNGDAAGGTLGWQATIGLAIRADRFDPTAARNLQTELGIEHAGFFVEGLYADVSGLGMDRKLRVGDLTWFAGVNFEF